VNVSGKTVFLMLFGVALAFSVDPIAGVFAFLALAAATNREAAVRVYHALNDAAYRVERQLEQRGWLPTAFVGSVTTQRINKEEDTVVTVDETAEAAAAVAAPAAAAPAAVTTPYRNKREDTVVTLPSPSLFNPTDPRPARYAVPLGRDQTGRFRWLDFGADALHIGLYGTSGCGKDHLLRLWFAALLNERDVRWAILDGKGDWLTPNLARLPQMLFPPAGGYGEEGQQRILSAIATINEEAKRRFGLLLSAGVRSVEEYNQTAPDPLPLLVVLATDIIDVVDETERLLIALVSKARALGIRVIVSMQTPTGKRLEWRMNLSTLIAGALVDGSQDAPALGVRDPKALLYRPSQLPPPPGERGLFVVRHNNEQFLIRTPALVGDFDALVNARNDAALLETLLSSAVTTPHINKREASVVTVADPVPSFSTSGDEITPSPRLVTPQTDYSPVPALSDAAGRMGQADTASESLGTGVDPSPSQTVPVSDCPEPPETAQIGDFSGRGDGDGGDDALLSALAALRRAGFSREQARALGARFRNEDWARAARLN
jgi:hypothetical protein